MPVRIHIFSEPGGGRSVIARLLTTVLRDHGFSPTLIDIDSPEGSRDEDEKRIALLADRPIEITVDHGSIKYLHLKTQDNQPYGSVRRCCEICGTMIWHNKLPEDETWTDDRSVYSSPPPGYVICRYKP